MSGRPFSSTTLDAENLTPALSAEAREAICTLITTSAMLEIALTEWLTRLVGMDSDIGPLLIGRMDNRAKIDKLKEIYAHLNNKGAVRSLKWLSKNAKIHSDVRNTVIHNICCGVKNDGNTLQFLTFLPVRGDRRHQVVKTLTFTQIWAASRVALLAAGKIRSIRQI